MAALRWEDPLRRRFGRAAPGVDGGALATGRGSGAADSFLLEGGGAAISGALGRFLSARVSTAARCRSSSAASLIAARSAWTWACSWRRSRLTSSMSEGSAPEANRGNAKQTARRPASAVRGDIDFSHGFPPLVRRELTSKSSNSSAPKGMGHQTRSSNRRARSDGAVVGHEPGEPGRGGALPRPPDLHAIAAAPDRELVAPVGQPAGAPKRLVERGVLGARRGHPITDEDGAGDPQRRLDRGELTLGQRQPLHQQGGRLVARLDGRQADHLHLIGKGPDVRGRALERRLDRRRGAEVHLAQTDGPGDRLHLPASVEDGEQAGARGPAQILEHVLHRRLVELRRQHGGPDAVVVGQHLDLGHQLFPLPVDQLLERPRGLTEGLVVEAGEETSQLPIGEPGGETKGREEQDRRRGHSGVRPASRLGAAGSDAGALTTSNLGLFIRRSDRE